LSETRRRYLFSALVKRNLLIHRTALQTTSRSDTATKVEVLDIFKSDDGDAFWLHPVFVTETSHIGNIITETHWRASACLAIDTAERA
jgi:hypothetical protein